MKRVYLWLVACLATAVSSSAQEFDVDTLLYNGSSGSLINFVFMGDGYTADQQTQFVSDAQDYTNDVFEQSPFEEYQSYFNVFAIKVISNESGADHPGTATNVDEPVFPVQDVDNYFGATFDRSNIHRLLSITNYGLAFNVLSTNVPQYDQAIFLVNTPYYGGAGGLFAVTSLHSLGINVITHELGHAFSGLTDEYWPGYGYEQPNMTGETNPDSVKWSNWYGDNGIDILQHCCGGSSSNWYRPHNNCRMRHSGSSFCAVCRERTIEQIHETVSPWQGHLPSSLNVTADSYPLQFQVNTLKPQPNTLKTEWRLNDSAYASQSDSISILSSDLSAGENSLVFVVEDTTQMLRIDDHGSIHKDSLVWNIQNPSGAPALSGQIVSGDYCGSEDIAIGVYNSGSAALVLQDTVALNENGGFELNELVAGQYDLVLKVRGSLSKVFLNMEFQSGSTTNIEIEDLDRGDLNGDNEINISDVTVCISAIFTSQGDEAFESAADLDCNGVVNLTDITLVLSNYGLIGEGI